MASTYFSIGNNCIISEYDTRCEWINVTAQRQWKLTDSAFFSVGRSSLLLSCVLRFFHLQRNRRMNRSMFLCRIRLTRNACVRVRPESMFGPSLPFSAGWRNVLTFFHLDVCFARLRQTNHRPCRRSCHGRTATSEASKETQLLPEKTKRAVVVGIATAAASAVYKCLKSRVCVYLSRCMFVHA